MGKAGIGPAAGSGDGQPGAALAGAGVGEPEVRAVLRHALARFQENGVVTLVNTFRWVAARRPL